MTDKELLELAAKAAGIPAYWSTDGTIQNRPKFVISGGGGMGTMPYEHPWNPLIDDGDALRLAVKLKINMQHSTDITLNPSLDCGRWSGATEIVHEWAEEPLGDVPYAATRRAIVRAAAEIGKGIAQKPSGQELPEDNYYKE